jgi:predicted SnoaL-like aldol condensation-catalyzing enzyme
MNKQSAISFLKTVCDRKIEEAYAKYMAPNMRHHNAHFPGDPESLKQGMIESHTRFPETTIDIKHAIEEGNLVSVFSHVQLKPNGPSVGVVHMFRFENGKIAEMWDIGQLVSDDSPNENGMF